MKQVRNLRKLNNLPCFDTQTVSQITDLEGQVLNNTVSRWQDKELIIRLKQGIYVTKYYFENTRAQREYIEFISNKLRYPSYISLEYTLSYYQILTESVFSITAITQKVPRNYTNKLGRFSYRSIREDLFTGFDIIQKADFDIAIATKAKALFDYLYLKFYRTENITIDSITKLRLNLDSFTKFEIKEFRYFCELVNIRKYQTLPNLLFTES